MKKYLYLLISISAFYMVSCEKPTTTEIQDEQFEQRAKIFIESNPKGLKIYFKNRYMGAVTPDTIVGLPEGNNQITLKHDLYPDTSFSVITKNDQTNSFFIDGFKNPNFYGSLICESYPNHSKVAVNDDPKTYETPLILNSILPGYYKVKFSYTEHRADSFVVKVVGSQVSRLNAILEDTTQIVTYKIHNTHIPSEYLTNIYIDNKNVKWIGTKQNGLIKFDGKVWETIDNIPQLKNKIIRGISAGKNNLMYVITSEDLLSYDGITWRILTNNDLKQIINCISIDNADNVWLGTTDGLLKYDGSTWSSFTGKNTFTAINNVQSIAAAQDGTLWIGDTTGVIKYSNNLWRRFNNLSMGLGTKLSNFITKIAIDNNQKLFVAHKEIKNSDGTKTVAEGAITKYDGITWRKISAAQFLINSIFCEQNGIAWFCTESGLLKMLPNESSKIYNRSFGLSSNYVKSLAIDKNGDYWVTTTDKGLMKIKKIFFQKN